MSSKRLDMLKNSLTKKQALLDQKFEQHFQTVKQANGQPLNDKRNGRATLNKWERQSDSIRTLKKSIEVTKAAIENEESTITHIAKIKDVLPQEILALLESGELVQWKKHPHTFFVAGVDNARIVWLHKRKLIAHKYSDLLTDKEQRSKFVKLYNYLNASLNS